MKLVKSIRLKYIMCLLSVSILPVLFFGVYTEFNNNTFYNKQVESASRNEIHRISSDINRNYEDVRDLISSLIFSTYDNINCITNIAQQEGGEKEPAYSSRLKNYRMFKYVCSNLLENARHADGVYLFCSNGHVYSYMKNLDYGIERTYKTDQWYQELTESKNSVEIAKFVELKKNLYGQGKECFLAARKFKNIKDNGYTVLAVVCKNTFFDNIKEENSLPWGTSVIVDEKGNVIYGSDTKGYDFSALKLSDEKKQGIIHNLNDKTQAAAYSELDFNNWRVVSVLSLKSFYDNYVHNRRIMFLLLGMDLIFVLFISLWMERQAISPIVHLAKIMDNVSDQNFQFNNEYKGRQDEIGILYADYEKMLNQLDMLIKEKYESQINILKSRLRNLTSQINSHFLFNTLENISCLAQLEGNKQIVIMTKSLGDMLRYTMDIDGDYITLEKEIGQMQRYLNIQEVRFGNEIKLELDLEEGVSKRKVMKYMLQPIVENAIEHGMSGKEFPWKLLIAAKHEGNDMYIVVKDNGTGMDEKTLECVRKRIYNKTAQEEEEKYFNIGLKNIHERIQLLFTEKYGMWIDSIPEEGTTVTLHVPWI